MLARVQLLRHVNSWIHSGLDGSVFGIVVAFFAVRSNAKSDWDACYVYSSIIDDCGRVQTSKCRWYDVVWSMKVILETQSHGADTIAVVCTSS